MFITCAPLSTAYLIASATSLSYSSPLGTALIGIINTLLATPFIPFLLLMLAPIIPAQNVP